MTLAQVVYQMSNDTDFLSQLLDNPESALKKKGFELSQEELAFLLTAHRAGSACQQRAGLKPAPTKPTDRTDQSG